MASRSKAAPESLLEEAWRLGREAKPAREAAQRQLLLGAVAGAVAAKGQAEPEARIEAGVEALVALLVEEPAMARLALVEIRTMGPAGQARYEAASERFASLLEKGGCLHGAHPGLEAETAGLIVGSVATVLALEVTAGRTAELGGLAPELVAVVRPKPSRPAACGGSGTGRSTSLRQPWRRSSRRSAALTCGEAKMTTRE